MRRMLAVMAHEPDEVAADEWVSFPGGELEGRRPRALCAACREALRRASLRGSAAPRDQRRARTLCFGCYRAEFDRQKAIAAAGRSEEHTSELQSLAYLVCRLLLEKKKN